jgi:Lon protease-like protein
MLLSDCGRTSADNEDMPALLLPLFPLSTVLLPSTPLPLHVFEERYKELMGLLIPDHGEFGVVLAKDGGLVNIGCTATVEQVVRRYPDGRLDILAMGRRRFQILSLDEEESYLRAEVDFFNDDDAAPVPPNLRQRAISEYNRLRSLEDDDTIGEPRLGEPQLSFQLAQSLDDMGHRQALLVMRSETERLTYLVQSLPGYITRRQQISLARRLAPRNGHARQYKEES